MKSILALAMLSCAIATQAQEVDLTSKFGIELQQHLGMNVNHSTAQTRSEAPKVRVLVSLIPAAGITESDLEAVGCEVNWKMKSQASVTIAVDQLEALAAIPGVRNVDLPGKAKLNNNIARKEVHVDEVADPKTAVAAGLPQGYDGTGVLVGILDSGIDFRHYAFRDEEGKVRFKKIFTMSKDSSFVSETDPDAIINIEPSIWESHGSHVLGIITGQELGNNLHGMAPKANIVAADFKTNIDSFVEGMKLLCEFAEENHQPIAINMSLGQNEGWNDGCNPVSEAMMELTDNGTKPGVIFSISAGNEGSLNNWVNHKFTADDEKLFVILDKGTATENFEGHTLTRTHSSEKIHAWVNTTDANKSEMLAVFDLDKKTMIEDPETVIGAAQLFPTTEANGDTIFHLWPVDGHGPSQVRYITLGQVRSMLKEVNLYSSSIHTCVDGVTKKSELWYHIKGGVIVMPFENLRLGACFSYPAGTEIRIGNFSDDRHGCSFIKPEGFDCAKASTSNGSLNIFACNPGNIATGSYCVRDRTINVFGYEEVDTLNVVNEVSWFSSYGYTGDASHLHKPEVLAPGDYIISATNNYYPDYFPKQYGVLNEDVDFEKYPESAHSLAAKATIDGQDYWYQYMQGTSMAAPVTTGVIALWLQANPNLSVADVREIIANTSTPFVSPNKDTDPMKCSAYGVINALEGLKYIRANMTNIKNISDDKSLQNTSTVYNLYGQPANGKGFMVKDGRVVFIK